MADKTVKCKLCGGPTTMNATMMCDVCWELDRRIRQSPVIASKIMGYILRENMDKYVGK